MCSPFRVTGKGKWGTSVCESGWERHIKGVHRWVSLSGPGEKCLRSNREHLGVWEDLIGNSVCGIFCCVSHIVLSKWLRVTGFTPGDTWRYMGVRKRKERTWRQRRHSIIVKQVPLKKNKRSKKGPGGR